MDAMGASNLNLYLHGLPEKSVQFGRVSEFDSALTSLTPYFLSDVIIYWVSSDFFVFREKMFDDTLGMLVQPIRL